ncbi:MAG: DUF4082 domain-containing protein [Alcaligenaceae bacterium]|nr:MAG: DUF4082 domain-containing protein [Alcaligenaceae bacterium]
MAVPAGATSANTSIDAWSTQWQEASLQTPCGSCTGRACTVCSIRVGGSSKNDGTPSGYAPKVLEYYNTASSVSTEIAPLIIDLSSMAVQGRPADAPTSGTQQTSVAVASGADAPANLTAATNPAAAPNAVTNAIVLENMKQGTPESVWLIDQADSSIEGFAAQFSINHGERVDFKINTDATNYRVDIYRLGYYGGDGAHLVTSFTKNLATEQDQPVPLFDPTTKLVDAGNWSVSASWDIPDDAVSGIYLASLTRLDTGGQNMIPFIVRDDEAPSDITFQASDTTWQAYNWWGGYNLYGGIDAAGHAGRASAVSYNRPIITRDGGYSAGPQDFIFAAEYPSIRWLEQNGYDVNYISGIDTARDGAQLLNSKVFLSIGHDEYWSAGQRTNVEAARDAGVNLAFLSGNEVYWEVRWENSIDGSGTPYKTMVSYKETWANDDVDPGHTTGTWRDPQFGAGKPENALTGTIFTVDSYRLDTIKIPYNLSQFRFWTNTAVQNLQPGQTYSLTPNLLGYEWDSDVDNGFRPAGLIALSSTTVDVDTLLLDYGNTTGPGTATHSLTLYRDPESGALVFGAGTVYWTWGLDSHHDNEATPTDPNVQQAMVNLFADMGVQPQTLMASLAVASQSTDLTAPISTVTSPLASGSFAAAQPIVITGTATDSGGGHVAVVEVSTNGGVSWHRATGFENWTYSWTPLAGGTYTILSRAVDDSVNMEVHGAGRTITVAAAPTTSFFSSSDVPAILTDTDVGFVNLGMRFSSSQSGTIVGIKYYKSVGDGGTHTGSLWSSTGTLLATAIFTQETASGWQTVTFANPVSISAGTTYVVSYHSNGHYANTMDYFTAPRTNGPLTAPVGNGYYAYSADTLFPTTAANGVNYWVDVIFSPTVTANVAPVGTNDNGFTVTRDTPTVFTAAQLLANDTDPNGDILTISGVGSASGGTVSLNSQTNTITFTPNPGYTGPAVFGYAISDGRGGTGSAVVNMTVAAPSNNVSLFSASDTPANLGDSDAVQVNLGVRFVSSSAGFITGIKYYKGANDTGTHTGSLWSVNGTLLATATFTNETASGWQTVTFANPVAITAQTTYVASYHSNGHYVSTGNYFTSNYVNGVLTAPGGANGVYAYGNDNLFPTGTFGSTNYWVDVLMSTGSTEPENHAPVATTDSGFTTPQGTTLTIPASALLANDTDADGDTLTITGAGVGVNGTAAWISNTGSITFTPTPGYTGTASFTYAISDGHGGTATGTVNLTVTASANNAPVATNDNGFSVVQNAVLTIGASALLANDTDLDGDTLTISGVSGGVHGTASFNAQTNTVTFTPVTGYTGLASFVYTISDGHGGTANGTVSLNVTAPPNHAPVANNDSGFATVQNTTLNIEAASLLANDSDVDGDPLTITGIVAGSASNGVATFNAQTNAITFIPTAGYVGLASFSYNVSDGRGGTAAATVNLNVIAPAAGVSLFSGSETPANLSDPDTVQVNLGMRFVTSQSGTITGIKYYKAAGDTGTHTGSLWSSTGTLLATATFTNETQSGWQTLTFTSPVAVTAGTTYVASYHSNGHYVSTSGYFSTAHTNGPLTAPAAGNGVYAYGNGNLFPSSSFGATNYWVDVVFSAASGGVNQAPIAANDSGFTTAKNAPLTINASALLANDSDPNNDTLAITGISSAVNGSAVFDAQTNTITFTPTAGYVGSATFNYAISDGHGGTANAGVTLNVTDPAATVSLFNANSAPSMISVNDPNPVELGLKFRASENGDMTGIRFYKGALNTGTHTANLWTATGTLLATATFTNESSSGWQQVEFAAPVSITANTTYVASYHTNGNYSADPGLFANSITNGPLTAPSSSLINGNGVYAYGSNSLFPSNTYNSTSYGVDVLFRPQLAA